MRNAGLIAFSVTTCVLVPAAIHRLSAGKEQIAKLAAPNEDTIEVHGAKIKASLDHYMLDPGDKLKVHLAASDIPGKSLEVGVLVLGSNGTEGSRVPSPPNGVAFRIIKLQAKDGAATGDMEVALKGATQSSWRPFGHYIVLVGEAKALAKLESLRGRSHYIGDEDEGIPSLNKSGSKFMELYAGYGISDEDEDSPYLQGKLARLEAHTRPKNSAISMSLPDTTSLDRAFLVSVTMKNPSRRAMKGLEVTLSEHGGFDEETYYHEPGGGRISIAEDTQKIDLAAHETRTLQFTVTPQEAGVIGMYASARCETNYEDETACRDVEALQLGAFDATEVRPVDEKAPTVVVR